MRLEADGIAVVRGGRTVLADVSAAFEPGSVTAILGPNGAGKSTLLAALAGLLPLAGGAVRLDGRPLADWSRQARARAIGFLPQGGEIGWNLEVRALVALGRLPHRGGLAGPGPDDQAAIAAAMAAADLDGLAGRRVLALSGGERARALLGRVLAGTPSVLLADEPLANLDPKHQLATLALLRAQAAAGRTVAVVLHDLQAAARAADRLLLVADGRLVAAGSPRAVLTPARIAAVYGVEMAVRDDPELGLLLGPPA
jgi:iron complex transport system ATP-binding protein